MTTALPEPTAERPAPGVLTFAAPRRAKPPRHLADLTVAERADAVAALGEKPFRARQLSVHYFERLVDDPAAMTDLPAATRERLVGELLPTLATPVRRLDCDGGTTVKTVWRLFDGALVESVLMRYPDRVTVCVSSQAGCGMNCPFCATGQAGLTRNLSTAEIVEQVVSAGRALVHGEVPGGRPGAADRVGNVVFMGMGEPLANYKAVIGAVRRLIEPAPAGLGISARGVTVSTVGLVPAIERLAGEGLPVTLALSLHAPDDELRDELVPINTRFTVAQALDACPRIRRHDRAQSEHRVRAHPRRQRPGMAGRPARARARPARQGLGAREPHPAQPHSRFALDGKRSAGPGRVRRTPPGPRCAHHGARHPRP